MTDREKKYQSADYITPPANYLSTNGQTAYTAPYNDNAVFDGMKKRATQAMTDHEVKG